MRNRLTNHQKLIFSEEKSIKQISYTASPSTPNPKLDIKVITKEEFVILSVSVSEHFNARQLKKEALKKLLLYEEESLNDYNLIRIRNKVRLNDNDSLSDIRNNEEFLLTCKRGSIAQISDEALRGPSAMEIRGKTSILLDNSSTNINSFNNFLQTDLQEDLRKLIYFLAQSSAYILCNKNYATKIISYYKQKILQNLGEHEVIQILNEFGFDVPMKDVLKVVRDKEWVESFSLLWLWLIFVLFQE